MQVAEERVRALCAVLEVPDLDAAAKANEERRAAQRAHETALRARDEALRDGTLDTTAMRRLFDARDRRPLFLRE